MMETRDAHDRLMLESDYEILYCVRDLVKIYEVQQRAVFGRSSKNISDMLENTQRLIENIGKELGIA